MTRSGNRAGPAGAAAPPAATAAPGLLAGCQLVMSAEVSRAQAIEPKITT